MEDQLTSDLYFRMAKLFTHLTTLMWRHLETHENLITKRVRYSSPDEQTLTDQTQGVLPPEFYDRLLTPERILDQYIRDVSNILSIYTLVNTSLFSFYYLQDTQIDYWLLLIFSSFLIIIQLFTNIYFQCLEGID